MSNRMNGDGPPEELSSDVEAEREDIRPSRPSRPGKRRSLRVPVDEVPRRSSLLPSAGPAEGGHRHEIEVPREESHLPTLEAELSDTAVQPQTHAIAPPAPGNEADFGDLDDSWGDDALPNQAPLASAPPARSFSKEPKPYETAFSVAYSAIEPAIEGDVTAPGTTHAPTLDDPAEPSHRDSQPAVVVAPMLRISTPPPPPPDPSDDEPELSFGEFDTFEELEEDDDAHHATFTMEDSGELELPEEEADEDIDEMSADQVDAEEELDEIDVVTGTELDSPGPKKKPRSVPPPPREPPRDKAPKASATPVERTVSEPPKRAKKKAHWWEDFFNDDYLRTVPVPSARQIARQCDFIESRLALKPGGTILDVGCGLGLQAVELTRRGYLVVGLDLSLPMLSRAADEAQDHGFRINFLHADMREMNFDGAFDAVMCIGTTYGYFDDDANRALVERLYRALRPKGKLLLEVANRDFVVKSQPNLVWFEGDGCVVMEETSANYITSRLEVKRTVILDDGRQRDNHYSVRLYALHELGLVLHQRGFRVLEVTGREATPGVFFGADSPKLIILAERRAQQAPPPPRHSISPGNVSPGNVSPGNDSPSGEPDAGTPPQE